MPDSSVCILGINGSGSNDQVARKTFGTSQTVRNGSFLLRTALQVLPVHTGRTGRWYLKKRPTIFIVDQRTAGWTGTVNVGVRVDSATTDEISALSSGSTNAPDHADNTHQTFIQGTQRYEMAGVAANMNPFVALTSAPFTISADFVNNGAASITGADINYSVNGGTATTSTLTGLSIASGASATVLHQQTGRLRRRYL